MKIPCKKNQEVILEDKDFIHNEALWFLSFPKNISGNKILMDEIIANIKKDIPLTGYKQIIQVEDGHIDCNLKDGRYYINISYFSRPRYDTFYDSFIENYPPETERFKSLYEFNDCYSWAPQE